MGWDGTGRIFVGQRDGTKLDLFGIFSSQEHIIFKQTDEIWDGMGRVLHPG